MELLQRGFEVGDDFDGEDAGFGQIGGIFKGFVFKPEDIKVGFVALDEFVVGEALEAPGFFGLWRFFGL